MSVAMYTVDSTMLGRPFTRADLDNMPADGQRYEIIDGTLYVSAAPGRLHQRSVGRLYRLLDDACPPDLEVMIAPFAVGLADDTEMQPDVLVGRREDFTDKDLPAPPVLAVEVLSTSAKLYDTHVKRNRLERARTPSFWVVDPVANPYEATLVAWELDRTGRYREKAVVVGEERFAAEHPFPVVVVPAELVR